VAADAEALVAREDVDAVLVTCPNAFHADVALAALRAGKHVLVEKPMCLTLREADALVAAQERTGLVLQVGYMRRYAEAFAEARRFVAELGEIRLARVRDVLGLNELIGDQATRVVRAAEVAPALAAEAADAQRALLEEAVCEGADDEDFHTYFFLLSLTSHDLSAMRDLLGMPRGVLYAARRDGGVSPFVTAALDFGGFVCHLEAGFGSSRA
jgi:predicted dehydrogenase